MGCWNETCMISHLPIMSGETVYGIVLVKNMLCGHGCYPSDFWTPLLSVVGQYDDYGRVEKVKKADTKVIWESMKRFGLECFIDKETGKPLYNETDGLWLTEDKEENDSSTEGFSIPQLFQNIRNGAFFVPKHGERQRLSIVFIKSSIKEKLEKTYYADVEAATFRKDIRHKFERLSSIQRQRLFTDDFDQSNQMMAIQHESLTLDYSEVLIDILRNVAQLLVSYDFYKEMSLFDFSFFVEMFWDLIMMNYVLVRLRMSWHIPSGSGSQDGVNSYMKRLNKQIKKELKQLQSIHKEM